MNFEALFILSLVFSIISLTSHVLINRKKIKELEEKIRTAELKISSEGNIRYQAEYHLWQWLMGDSGLYYCDTTNRQQSLSEFLVSCGFEKKDIVYYDGGVRVRGVESGEVRCKEPTRTSNECEHCGRNFGNGDLCEHCGAPQSIDYRLYE